MSENQVWIVGARETCDIVVNEPTVSGEHCRLEKVDGMMYLNDLDSTNGVFVNGERIQARTRVTRHDHITLGRTISFPFPEMETPTPPPMPETGEATDDSALPVPAIWLVAGGSILGGLLLVLVLIIVLSRGNPSPEPDPPIGPDDQSTEDDPPIGGDDIPQDGDPEPEVDEKIVPADEACYVLAVGASGEELNARIGSAIAIGPHTLLTTATSMKIADLAKQRLPQLKVLGDQQLTITKVATHPQYDKFFQDVVDVKEKLDQFIDEMRKREDDPEVENQIQQRIEQFGIIAERPHFFDIAVIQVKEELPGWVKLSKVSNFLPLSRLTLIGHAFDHQSPFIPQGANLPLKNLRVEVDHSRKTPVEGLSATLLTMKMNRGVMDLQTHRETNLLGSALIDDSGELVGLYSRITPGKSVTNEPIGELFDATILADLDPFIQQFQDTE